MAAPMAARTGPRAPQISLELLVESEGWPGKATLTRLAEKAIAAAVVEAGLSFDGPAELSLLFADDERLRRLNSTYRNKDMATNVLSFPGPDETPPGVPRLIGDIVLGRQTVEREAEAAGLTMTHHLGHLIVHGFLHLCGYDHESGDQAEIMEGLEVRILGRLGIADPYTVPEPAVRAGRGR
jgi:probable rRNA maturation factor